jgi:hypothetical protein
LGVRLDLDPFACQVLDQASAARHPRGCLAAWADCTVRYFAYPAGWERGAFPLVGEAIRHRLVRPRRASASFAQHPRRAVSARLPVRRNPFLRGSRLRYGGPWGNRITPSG